MVDQDLLQCKDFDGCLKITSHILIFDLHALDFLTRQFEGHIDDMKANNATYI